MMDVAGRPLVDKTVTATSKLTMALAMAAVAPQGQRLQQRPLCGPAGGGAASGGANYDISIIYEAILL